MKNNGAKRGGLQQSRYKILMHRHFRAADEKLDKDTHTEKSLRNLTIPIIYPYYPYYPYFRKKSYEILRNLTWAPIKSFPGCH